MIFVALAMVAIVAMAALSIDVITLYLAREEAQRAADSSALSAAKIISLSGMTGDPQNASGNWGLVCGGDDSLATRVAKAVATQNSIGGQAATTPTVLYSAGSGGSMGAGVADCTSLTGTAFGVNPIVTVQLQRANLPTFFSRIWGITGNTISATATAEAFNPSNSGNSGNQVTGIITPVQPRCVKPWVVPNEDPMNGGATFVSLADGSITNRGISLGGVSATGVIGETFWLTPDCGLGGGSCVTTHNPPAYNVTGLPFSESGQNLQYVPGQVGSTSVIGVPSCTSGDPFEVAIEGCDQPTNYSCGVPDAGNVVDLSENPINPTVNGVGCLIHQKDVSNVGSTTGQDYFPTFAAPATYPFPILAGAGSTAVAAGIPTGAQVSTSSSIVSLPIYDHTAPPGTLNPGQTPVTFVGFLQVFINAVDTNGNMNVTVLNVAGCSNGSGTTVDVPVIANSPVPVRLVTPP
jgi:hypothetical protein